MPITKLVFVVDSIISKRYTDQCENVEVELLKIGIKLILIDISVQ